jgi:hypothetical protein
MRAFLILQALQHQITVNATLVLSPTSALMLRTPASWARRMSWRCALGTWAYASCLLCLVVLLPLPLFFRFVALV